MLAINFDHACSPCSLTACASAAALHDANKRLRLQALIMQLDRSSRYSPCFARSALSLYSRTFTSHEAARAIDSSRSRTAWSLSSGPSDTTAT